MRWIFKLIIIILISFIIYKFYLFYIDFYVDKTYEVDNLSHLLYLLVALVLFVLLAYAINLFLYIIPFFYRNNFGIIKNIENYKNTLISPNKTKIFNAHTRHNVDILFCGIFELKRLNHAFSYINFYYLDFYFLGVFIRVKRNIDNDFDIFASEKLINLYYPNGFEIKKRFLTDNVEFNKKFYLYPSTNNTKDFNFLNPKKLSDIANAAKPINKKFSVVYTKDYLEIYIHNFLFSSNIKNEFISIMKIIKEFNGVK